MIVVTGASGHLGHHAVEQLLEKGERVVAVARTLDKAKDLAKKGAELRHADYDQPETLAKLYVAQQIDAMLERSAQEAP